MTNSRKPQTKWFAVPIYLRCSEREGRDVLLQESIRLIRARSEGHAGKAAAALAHKLEHSYKNVHGREVSWTVYDIGQPWEIESQLRDGTEVYPRFLTAKVRERLRRI